MTDPIAIDPEGLAIYKAYGGEDAVNKFLAGFAPTNPELANLTVLFAYKHMLANPILDYKTKAAMIISLLGGLGTAPGAMDFHMNSYAHNGGSIDDAKDIQMMGRSLPNHLSLPEMSSWVNSVGQNIGSETAALCCLTTYACQGSRISAETLKNAFTVAEQMAVSADKILFAISLVAPYAGLPVAIAASALYQRHCEEKAAISHAANGNSGIVR